MTALCAPLRSERAGAHSARPVRCERGWTIRCDCGRFEVTTALLSKATSAFIGHHNELQKAGR